MSDIDDAKVELQEIQAAITAAMAEAGVTEIEPVDCWHGERGRVTDGKGKTDAGSFVKDAPRKGCFSISKNGKVTCTAFPRLVSGSKSSFSAADAKAINEEKP